MGKAVAVKGCTIEDIDGGGTVEISTSPSDKNLATGIGIYFGTLMVSVDGSTGKGGITDGNGVGAGTLDGTGDTICDAGGNPAVLVDDEATITVTGTSTSGSTTTIVSEDITVKITDAGQDKVIAL